MGKFEKENIPMELYKVPWENLISHGTIQSHGKLIFPWEFKISHGILSKSHGNLSKSHGEKNNPMGKFNFPWEFSPLILIISPARCEQVKSKLVFDYAEPDLQHGSYGFSLCWS